MSETEAKESAETSESSQDLDPVEEPKQERRQRYVNARENRWPGECSRCGVRVAEREGEIFEGPLRLCCAACSLREGVKNDNGLKGRVEKLPLVSGGKEYNLLPFQLEDCKRLATTRALLVGSACGTGKTIQVAVASLRSDTLNLVFCPASVRENWVEEIRRWRADLDARSVANQVEFASGVTKWIGEPGRVVVCSYGLLPGSPCRGCRALKTRLRELRQWKENACLVCERDEQGIDHGVRTIKVGEKCMQCGNPTVKISAPRYTAKWYPACSHTKEAPHPPHADIRIDKKYLRLPFHPRGKDLNAWLAAGIRLPDRGRPPEGLELKPEHVKCKGCGQPNPMPAFDRPVVLIGDEAHAFKTPSAERTKNWRALRMSIWNASGSVFGLTGTPCEGKPLEFWEVLQSLGLARAAFGNWDNYYRIFQHWFENPKGQRVPPQGELRLELYQRLKKVQVRRLRKDVLKQLPPRQEIRINVDINEQMIHDVNEAVHRMLAVKRSWEDVQKGAFHDGARLLNPFVLQLTPDERQRRRMLYDTRVDYYFRERPWIMDHEIVEAVDEALTSKGQMPTIEELSRIRAMLSKAKIAAVKEWIEDREAEDEPVVLFSQHVGVLKKIAGDGDGGSARPGWECFHGGLSAKARQSMVKRFQSGEIERGLCVSLGAGGEGITLTRAAVCAFIDLSFNPAKNWQGESRLIRIGAERHDVNAAKKAIEDLGCTLCRMEGDRAIPCEEHKSSIVVVRFIAKHCVDQLVMKTLEEKEKLLAALDWEEEEK